MIGAGTSAITEDPELTWNGTTNILTVSGTGAITTVSATNIGIGITNPTTSSLEVVRPVTTVTDIINMRYDANNGLRYQQAYVAANDVKYNIIQKSNNVDTNMLTYYKGNIGIGTTAPAATDKLSVTGNTKITGTATIDTNLVVGGSAGIVGTGQFSGLLTTSEGLTIPINKTFTSNGHISANTLQTSGFITANTITSSGLLTANGGIQASTIKIGAGGLLKMATSTADMTQIGTTDSLLSVATCINLNGYTRASYPSCILYNCEQLGKHIFFTTNAGFTLERLRIENNGNVGIGTTDPGTYKLNVGGTLNTSGTITTSGEIITTAVRLAIVGSQPTLYLRHTNSAYRSAMIHCNGNLLYFLGAPYGGTPTQDNWGTVGSGQWPLTLNLTNNEANFGGNVNVQSLNNIGVSDFLRASQNVFFSKADYCRFDTATAYSSYSQFTINANLLLSEYYRPQVQWRWFIGLSTGDTGRVFSWGFWCVYYDQYYNSFTATRLAGTGDVSISQNWDGSGWNRCIITIINGNPAYQLNINIS